MWVSRTTIYKLISTGNVDQSSNDTGKRTWGTKQQFPSADKLHLKNCMGYSTYVLSATRYKAYKAAVIKTTYVSGLK